MVRGLKKVWLALLIVGAAQSASAFSLLGPSPAAGGSNAALAWQNATPIGVGAPAYSGDIGGPLNLGEEFRWNVPTLTYGYDQSFLQYFGLDGVRAIEEAFKILNNLGPVSGFSDNLSEFPLDATRRNFQAQALNLIDIKSIALGVLVEQLGLADPVRFTWVIRERRDFNLPTTPSQPITAFWVINRNFDPITLNPSAHINNVLYTYRVEQFTNPTWDEALEVRVDPAGRNNFPIASAFNANFGVGTFFTGLTRDDAGALRYLYRTNNYNVETFPTGIDVLQTNTEAPEVLQTFDLASFLEDTSSTTNQPGTVASLYPGVSIVSVRTNIVLQATTNHTLTYPGFPSDITPATNVTVTLNSVTNFDYTIDNAKVLRLFGSTTNFVDQLSIVAATNFVPPFGNLTTNRTRVTQELTVTTNLINCTTNMVLETFGTLSTNDDVMVEVVTCETNYTHTVITDDGTTRTTNEVASMVDSNFVSGEIYFLPANIHDYQLNLTSGLDGQFTNTLTINRTNIAGQIRQDFFHFTNDVGGEIALNTLDLELLTTNTFQTTNDPTAMLALVPDLIITRTNITQERFTSVTLSNNIIVTNEFVTNAYTYSFGNILTNTFVERQWVTNRIVEIVANPLGGITGETNITNILLSRIATAGGSFTTKAAADLDPLGVQNDINFEAVFNGEDYNDVEIRFIDDGSVTGNKAVAAYTNAAKMIVINIDQENTDAAAVVNAFAIPVTAGGSAGTKAQAFSRFGLANSHMLFEADLDGTAGNGLTVRFIPAIAVTGTAPTLTFRTERGNLAVDSGDMTAGFYDTGSKTLDLYIQENVTTAKNIVDYLSDGAATAVNDIPAFRADYDVALDLTVNPANDGSDVLTFSGGFAQNFNLTTVGGTAGAAAEVEIRYPGPNNDLAFTAKTGGTAGNDLVVNIVDFGGVTADRAVPIYNEALNVLTVHVLSETTTATTIKTAIETSTETDMVAFNAKYAVALATANEIGAANDGSGVINSVPFTAALDGTSEAGLAIAGANNDLFVETVAGGGAGTNLFIALFDIGSAVGSSPKVSYDPEVNDLLVEVETGVTTAAEVVAVIAADTATEMDAFRSLYSVTLDTIEDPGNDGSGSFAAPPVEFELAILDTVGNAGIGKLGANVNVAVLEERAGGDFVAVPVSSTNAIVGYHIIETLLTNKEQDVTFIPTNSTFLHTNTSQLITITNLDLCDFKRIVETNTPAMLQSLFPDLVITRTNTTPGLVLSNTITGVITNVSPYRPALTIPGTLLVTNVSTNIVDFYQYEFGNVITNSTAAYEQVSLLETNIVQDPYSPAGVTNLLTNVTMRTVNIPGPCGSIMIIPTNTTPRIYDYHIVSTLLTNVTQVTNTIYSVVVSNAFGGSFSNTLSQISYSTNFSFAAYPIEFRDPRDIGTNGFGLRREQIRNIQTHVLAAYPIQIVSNAPGLEFPIVSERTEIVRQGAQSLIEVVPIELVAGGTNSITALRPGVDQVTFTNVAHDGANFIPLTNVFSASIITNGTNQTFSMRRVANQPDIIFQAEDLQIIGSAEGFPFLVDVNNPAWQLNDGINGSTTLAGPGVIQSPVTVTFTTLLPALLNSSPFTFDESQAQQTVRWGWFDGSGAEPIVFPDGATIQDAENAVLSE